MLLQLLLANVFDFAVFVFAVLVCFSAALLFFDSWQVDRKKHSPLIRALGFLLLAFVYALYAAAVNTSVQGHGVQILKVAALLCILLSLLIEPILHKPNNKKKATVALVPLLLPVVQTSLIPIAATLLLMIAIWYLLRSTRGIDKQLWPAAIAFFLLAIAEFTRLAFFWADTTLVFWSKLLAVHSWIWNVHIAIQLIAFLILAKWVWGYIRFRLQIQLFSTILTLVFGIFIVSTSFFSYLLLQNIETDALSHLATDAKVFQYALDRLQLESLAHARTIATNAEIQSAISNKNSEALYAISSEFLVRQNLSSLVITDADGKVLMRAEDRENIGDSIATEPVIASALTGQQLSNLQEETHPLTPQVAITSAVPIYQNNAIIGTVSVGFIIDTAFVDGVKAVTGLDATVFAGTTRAATTLVGPDGVSRYVGTMESNAAVQSLVLEKNQDYVGATEILNEPYYSAYTPLLNSKTKPIGMLFIGRPQIELLSTMQASINSTFLGSIVLLGVSILPAYLFSRYLRENLQA